MDNEAAVRLVVEAWARAIRDADMAGVLAHHDVAFCHSIVTVGAADPASQFPVRLTVGLRKIDGEWRIVHEHHSGTGA